MPGSVDWNGLEVTGADNLVDGRWTSDPVAARDNDGSRRARTADSPHLHPVRRSASIAKRKKARKP
jgi:hypothetical protein